MTTVCPCNNGVCNCHKNEWFCICQDWCKPTKEYEYDKKRRERGEG